jgi:UDP-N-acetylmuramoyl-tripeptide--D-alanyl-D-alanine ligase
MQIRDIVNITGGKLLSGDAGRKIDPATISTDSRTIEKGAFFIALQGSNFNGNDFAGMALERGACGAMISNRQLPIANRRHVIIRVNDTAKAFRDIAACHRKSFKIPVVCITGSNGKTTVKDMAWHLLSSKYNVLRNEGTKNNHIGVPQTLLKLNSKHEICVLELGANHRGEIGFLADIARPTVAVITNIGPSHLEFFGDLKGVFEAKREILSRLDKDGTAILNGDDELLSGIRKGEFRIKRYGFDDSNDLCAEADISKSAEIIFAVNNKMVFGLNVLGRHNIYNALAAIAVAMRFGIGYRDMRRALADYKPTSMRLELEKVAGIDVLNDAYNSNPASMMKALDVIKYYPAKAKWIVSGDMLELGREREHFHRIIGESIAKSGIEGLVTFGELSKHTMSQARAAGMRRDRIWHCSTHDEIAELLKKMVKRGDVLLLKGSRSMRMEKVLGKLKAGV